MGETVEDAEREERIMMEIVVDAYDAEERAMGWYYYLADHLQFPFEAMCRHVEVRSPLLENEEVTVLSMAPEEDCQESMWVQVEWQNRKFAVPLVQLQPLTADNSTLEAVSDWHYWVEQGYLF